MNIYEKQQIKCLECGKFIGEIDIDSSITYPLCKKCKKKEKKIIRNEINNILVPVDISDKTIRALDAAIYLVKRLGAQMTLLYVVPEITMGDRFFMKSLLGEMLKTAKVTMKYAKDYCDKNNIVTKHLILRGDEPEKIIEISKKQNFDLIVIGSDGKGILKELVFGSVSNYVMQNSDVPVMIVKETSPKLDTKIIKKGKSKKLKTIRHGQGRSFTKMKKKAGLK